MIYFQLLIVLSLMTDWFNA